eukprot:g18090.t2
MAALGRGQALRVDKRVLLLVLGFPGRVVPQGRTAPLPRCSGVAPPEQNPETWPPPAKTARRRRKYLENDRNKVDSGTPLTLQDVGSLSDNLARTYLKAMGASTTGNQAAKLDRLREFFDKNKIAVWSKPLPADGAAAGPGAGATEGTAAVMTAAATAAAAGASVGGAAVMWTAPPSATGPGVEAGAPGAPAAPAAATAGGAGMGRWRRRQRRQRRHRR